MNIRARSLPCLLAAAVGLALAAGCPPLSPDNCPDANGNGVPDCQEGGAQFAPGSLSGRLSVQPSSSTITSADQEPNDSLLGNQFVGSIAPGQSVSIFGNVSLAGNDRFDGYEIFATEDTQLEVTLTYAGDPGADLDLAVHDFTNFSCAPGGVGKQEFAECFDSPGNPKSGSFRVSGPFVLAVTPFAGTADYQVDIVASSPAPPDVAQKQPQREKRIPWSKPDPPPQPARPFTDIPDAATTGELIVKFEDGLTPEEEENILIASGMRRIERSPSGYSRVAAPLQPAGGRPQSKLDVLRSRAILRGQPKVQTAETNDRRYIAITPNDPFYQYQWAWPAINMPDAWTLETGSSSVVVAVIDTGILSGHPDLQGQITGGYNFVSDPESARNNVGRSSNPEDLGDLFGGPGQSSFHGTHVVGTISAASNNGEGIAGVAWRGKIMPLRALGVGGGTTFDVAEAIRYAAGLPNISNTVPPRPARIINLSVAGVPGVAASSDEASAVQAAISAGSLVVAAAGNANSNSPTFPAALPGVVGVGAVDIQLNRAPYSNFGPWITLVAPGGFNGTDINGDDYGDGIVSTGGSDSGGTISFEYVFSNGTSMAAPIVSGVAALVMAANPSLTAAEVIGLLQSTAHDLGAPGRDDQFGFGLVDAAAAVREALTRAGSAPANSPLLALSASSVDFGTVLNSMNVYVSNTGGGFLRITSVVAAEESGSGWLSAHPVGSKDNANADTIFITVNRAGQPAGTHRGTVTVTAESLAPQVVTVSMNAGSASAAEEAIYVLAVRPPPDLDTAAETVTSAGQEYAYTISDLAPGDYIIYAGTDRNNNGIICETGDLCGALPSLLEPQIVTVASGQNLSQQDFSVSLRVLQQGLGIEKPPQVLRRLLP